MRGQVWGHQVLTIKSSVPGSQCVNQEGAALFHQASEGGLSLPGQLLLYLTGTASVLLGTDPEVLTWTEETRRNGGKSCREIPSFSC